MFNYSKNLKVCRKRKRELKEKITKIYINFSIVDFIVITSKDFSDNVEILKFIKNKSPSCGD